MNKQECISLLHNSHNELYRWIDSHPDDKFEYSPTQGKWTTAQHIDHLIKAINALSKAMSMPKFILKYKFGACNRPERSLEEMKAKYYNKLEVVDTTEFNSNGRFAPRSLSNSQKQQTIRELKATVDKLIKKSSSWSEASLSKYVLPHPALGRMTVRELLMFTSFHTQHHLDNLKSNYE